MNHMQLVAYLHGWLHAVIGIAAALIVYRLWR
jgi:hypothetical protein